MFAWYGSAERYLIPAQLMLVMAGMGATLSLRDFADVVRAPSSLVIAMLLQWVMVPLAAAATIAALDLSPGWTLGLLLIAAAPPAAFSNVFTLLGRGNLALSVSTTAVITVGTVLTVPLLLGTMAAAHLPADFAFPTRRIVTEIALFMLLPLGLGMALRHRVERQAQRVSRALVRASLAVVAVIFIGALGSRRIEIAAYGWQPPLRILGFGVVMALITPQLCRLLGRYDRDTLALSVQVSMRNMGVALLMVRFFLPGTPDNAHILYSCLLYSGAGMWLAMPAVIAHRGGKSVVLGRRRRVAAQTLPS